jgi:hypothetical protein
MNKLLSTKVSAPIPEVKQMVRKYVVCKDGWYVYNNKAYLYGDGDGWDWTDDLHKAFLFYGESSAKDLVQRVGGHVIEVKETIVRTVTEVESA